MCWTLSQRWEDCLCSGGKLILYNVELFKRVFVFFSAGIDSEGHAANYVETEQIVQFNSAKASFVQVSQILKSIMLL